MDDVKRFEDLDVFNNARKLCVDIYEVTRQEKFKQDSRFVQQIRASVGSIMDNIAEGFERNGNKEFVQFLYIAKGSCGETRSQIIRATDVGFIEKNKAKELYESCISLSKGIYKLIASLKDTGYKGTKYM